LATAGSAATPAVEDDVALADEVPPEAADDEELLDELLLPQPTMTAAARSRTTTESQLFRAGMCALLLTRFTQKTHASIGNIAFTGQNF
jgi:hypothetical protein